jgi:hypothetical protein
MDANAYRDLVTRSHAKMHAAKPGSAEQEEMELLVYVLARLRNSWRDKMPGRGAPYLFFTSVLTPGQLRSAVQPVWVDLFLDDARAARAIDPAKVTDWAGCAKAPADCCKREMPVICSFDARCIHAPPHLPNECLATLCHECLRLLPYRP